MSDKTLEEELFETVYQWGRVGIVVNHMAPTYRRMVNDIRADEANKARTLIWGIGYDNDPTALHLREQLWERIYYLKNLNQEQVSDLKPSDREVK
jgi:hypothetical protein